MARLKHEAKVVLERDVAMLTVADVKAHLEKQGLVRPDRRIVIKQGAETRPLDQLPPGMSLGASVDTKSIPSGTIKGLLIANKRMLPSLPRGTRKGAAGRREHFIKAQVASITEVMGERHGQVVQLDTQLRFVVIPQFRLPRRWGMKTTPILIWFPPQYPDIPPHGFYLSRHCVGPHVLRYNVYKDSPDLSAEGWNWYCVYPKGWIAKADPLEPDNLWTFLDVVRTSLTIDEF